MIATYLAATGSPQQAVPCWLLPITCVTPSNIGHAANALNPLSYLADGLQAILGGFLNLLQRLLIAPVLPTNGSVLMQLYGESLGLKGLAYYLLAATLTIALYVRKVIVNVIQGAISLVILTFLAEATFHMWDWLIETRATFIYDMIHASIFGSQADLFNIGDLTGIVFIIIGAGLIGYYTIYLIIMMYIEFFAIVLTKFATPIALLLYPYGERGKKALSWCIAAGFVSTFAGPLTAAFVLELGRLLVHGFEHAMVADTLFTVASLRIAAKSQRTMYKSLQSASLNKIKGWTSGVARVTGNVSASIRQQLNVDVRNHAATAHAAALQPAMQNRGTPPSKTEHMKHAAKIALGEGLIFAAGIGEAKLVASAARAGTQHTKQHKASVQVLESVSKSAKEQRGKRRRR